MNPLKISLALLLAPILSTEAGQLDSLQFRSRFGIWSEYIGLQGLPLYQAPVSVNELNISSTNSYWYANIRNSIGLASDRHGKFGDEVDFTVGWKRPVGPLALDIGVSYFILGDWSISKDDRPVLDFKIEASKIPFVQPYLHIRYFGRMDDSIPEGLFFWVGARRSQDLFKGFVGGSMTKLSVDAQLAFATEDSFNREGGLIFGRIKGTLDVPLAKKMSLAPFYMIQIPSGDQSGVRGDYTHGTKHVFGGSLVWKW